MALTILVFLQRNVITYYDDKTSEKKRDINWPKNSWSGQRGWQSHNRPPPENSSVAANIHLNTRTSILLKMHMHVATADHMWNMLFSSKEDTYSRLIFNRPKLPDISDLRHGSFSRQLGNWFPKCPMKISTFLVQFWSCRSPIMHAMWKTVDRQCSNYTGSRRP